MKHIYLVFALFASFTAQPLCASEVEPEAEPAIEAPMDFEMSDDREGIETEIGAITISVNGSQLHITNANGQTLEIYNLTGVRVATIKIESDDLTYNMNLPKGCYMIKVGKVVRKVSFR